MRSLISLISAAVLAGAACSSAPAPADSTAKSSGGMHATLETDKGSMDIEFLAADAPKAVENFRLLAEKGYYNGLKFHRIIRGFMIQGGDPKGDGTGGESAWGGTFADEINRSSPLYQAGYKRGLVAMANAGPNTNGSQFFVMLADYPLQPNYVIFARVTSGLDTLDALGNTPVATDERGEPSRPVTPPILKKVTIKP